MARGTQFSQLVYMLRAELRRSTNVNVGVDDLPELKQAINRQYAIQWARRDWPFLCVYFPAVQANAGQQYYDFPIFTGSDGIPRQLTYDRVKRVAVYFSGVPQRIDRGISFEDYVLFDPSTGAYSDPIMKWDVRAGVAGQEQFEIWPVPSSNSQTVNFFGYVTNPVMINDSDLCWLDDQLIVLYAAAAMLSLDESEPRMGLPPAATLKLQEAEGYYHSLVSNSQAERRVIAIGQGHPYPKVDTNSLVRVRG